MKLHLTFVVNGEKVDLELPPHEPLRAAVQQALAKSNNTGRDADQWELRYESGLIIPDVSKPVAEYGFAPGTCLYLTLRVGAGGHAPRSRR